MKINFLQFSQYDRALNNKTAFHPVFGSAAEDSFAKEDKETKFRKQQKLHSETAFLYDPSLKPAQKRAMLEERPHIVKVAALAKELNIPSNSIDTLIKAGTLLGDVLLGAHPERFVDTDFEQNKELIKLLKSKLPTSTVASKLEITHNAYPSQIKRWLENADIVPLGVQYQKGAGFGLDGLMIDLSDTRNQKTLSDYNKLMPIRSNKYYKERKITGEANPSIMVPVNYLSRLGFGDARKLAGLIQKGVLPGKLEKVNIDGVIKVRAAIDVEPYIYSEEKLKRLRASNPNTVEASKLAQSLNIKHKDLKEAILEDRVQIVPDFIFDDDHDKVFINLGESKNQEFVEKVLFEQELAAELKRMQTLQSKANTKNGRGVFNIEQSLKMKIAWQLCTKTRATAIDEAKNDGYLASVLIKDSEGEELTSAEQIKLNNYRKRFWSIAGTAEFKAALKNAKLIMQQFREEGIDSIENQEIKAILKDCRAQ